MLVCEPASGLKASDCAQTTFLGITAGRSGAIARGDQKAS